MFENAVVRSPLLHDDSSVFTEDTNTGSKSTATKQFPDLSRFELPVVVTPPLFLANANKTTQQKQHEEDMKFKKDFHAKITKNEVC